MAVAVRNPALWTPDGEVPLREKDVIPITRMELITLSRLHEFAQKHGISVVCQRCDKSITGKNSGHENNPGVACQCREWRFSG